MNRYKDWHLRPLLLLVFMAFNGTLLALITTVIYFSVSNLVTKETTQARLQLLAANQKQLTAILRDMEETALSIATNPDIKKAVSTPTSDAFESIRKREEVNGIINPYLYSKAYINSIHLFTDEMNVPLYSAQNRVRPLSEIMWQDDKSRLDKADSLWIGAHPDPYALFQPKSVLTYVARVYSVNAKAVAYLEINVLEQPLTDLLNESGSEGGAVVITDSGGRLVTGPTPLLPAVTPSGWLEQPWLKDIQLEQSAGFRRVTMEGTPYLVIFSSPNHAQWRTFEMIPARQVYSQAYAIRDLLIGIGVLALLLSFPLASYLSRRIVRPIPELLTGFRLLQDGNFDQKATENNHIIEFRQLSESFNKTGGQLKELLSQLQKEHRAKRDAELRALQSQINPHFLYNTLDMINWAASMKGVHEVSEMAAKLAKLLRISLSRGKSFIKLGEELEHSRIYAQIQQIRFKDKFRYTESVDRALFGFYVPKLILQPFVENAIIHGFGEGMAESAEVRIRAELVDGQTLRLIVEDNGRGLPDNWREISEEKAAQAFPSSNGSSGYGVKNVTQRIQWYLGDNYGVHLENGEISGVRVVISLPAISSVERLESYYDN